jgi:guanine deaminase
MKKDESMELMRIAVDEAFSGMHANEGGPFGAVIVRDGKIVARSHNLVVSTNDPTAHAEIVAIRRASETLGKFDLSDCEMFASCEPCPMCYAAIHWARIRKVLYLYTRDDAARAGFDDRELYEILAGRTRDTQTIVEQFTADDIGSPFDEWIAKLDKTAY